MQKTKLRYLNWFKNGSKKFTGSRKTNLPNLRKCVFWGPKNTRDHFLREGMHRKTIDRILDRFEERGNPDFKKKTGRPVVLGSPKVVKKVEKAFVKNPNISDGAVATKVGLSRS